MESQAEQEGQRPLHFEKVSPHSRQAKTRRDFFVI
jgi:hypothetical protein